jgi:exo-beta-1,3-glucanase (GH17 family)
MLRPYLWIVLWYWEGRMRQRIGWRGLGVVAAGALCLAGTAPWADPRAAGLAAPEAGSAAPLHGMAYGPYRQGQSPDGGPYPTLAEVREDMPLLALVANGIRTYGCQHLETVVTAAQEIGLPLALGAWLSGDAQADRAEIECAVAQAQASPNVTSLVVGSESVLRGQVTPGQVCDYLQEVRERTGLPVTTAEPWHVWVASPELAACADFLLVHIHPYWECQTIESAVAFVQEKVGVVSAQFPGQRVVIGETGWPTEGTGREPICGPMPAPTPQQQVQFAAQFLEWAGQAGVEYYFFDAFDEPWKCESGRPPVECRWGIYDTARVPKPARSLFVAGRAWLPLAVRGR